MFDLNSSYERVVARKAVLCTASGVLLSQESNNNLKYKQYIWRLTSKRTKLKN